MLLGICATGRTLRERGGRRRAAVDRSDPTVTHSTMSAPERPRRSTMPVGKATATSPQDAGNEFRFVVPCLTEINEKRIRAHLERDHFFWLDLSAPSPAELERLQVIFGFHPLAVEDTQEFGQRPKLDD